MENTNLVRLENLRENEKILLVIRRHWIAFVYLSGYVIFFLASALFAIYLHSTTLSSIVPGNLFWVAIICYSMFFAIFIYVQWLNNELDLFIVTNERIIGLDQISLLDRAVSECSLDRVQEINPQTKGLLSNLLNFGRLTVHTASEFSHFDMPLAPDPLENARRILNICQDYKSTHNVSVPTSSEKPIQISEGI